MVGRLVEYQEVHRFQQQPNHSQSTAFTTTQHLHFLIRFLAAKHKGAKDVVDFQADIPLSHIVNGLKYRQVLIQQLGLVLGKITYLYVMSHLQVTLEWNLTHDTFNQRRFTLAVLSHKSHLLPSLDGQVDIRENSM